jgi:hypothetical protein
MSSFTDLNKQIEFWLLDKEGKAQPAKEFLKSDSTYKVSAYQWRSRLMPPRIDKNRQNGYNVWLGEKDIWGGFQYKVAHSLERIELLYAYENGRKKWYSPIIKPITCADSSKLELLKKDLKALLDREPNMRAVVYSQFSK